MNAYTGGGNLRTFENDLGRVVTEIAALRIADKQSVGVNDVISIIVASDLSIPRYLLREQAPQREK